MILFRLAGFLKYQVMARHTNGHGIHSPIVFDMAQSVLSRKKEEPYVRKIENLRKSLRKDRREIPFDDFGAGSVAGGPVMKRVSSIASKSPVSRKYGIFLSAMAEKFGGGIILELGTSLGISTLYLASGAPGSVIHTIEGSEKVAALAEENFMKAEADNIIVHKGRFDDLLPGLMENIPPPGLVFIDGNHRKEPLLKYFGIISAKAGKNSVVVIDDINYSAEMAEAWEKIKKSPAATATIDIYRMGIVLLSKTITPNDYIIRY
jgi:predicted O-methyltransferase YrrM